MAPRLLTVLNDVHIGTVRSAGTTPSSAYALRGYLLQEFEFLMNMASGDVLINGDLLDKEIIPLSDLAKLIGVLSNWLETRSKAAGHKLFISAGNHDLPKTSSNQSSLQFLGRLLTAMYPDHCMLIEKPTEIYDGHWVLPHLANQDLLDAALEKIPECEVLYVHTNFDNNFAAQSDQSLNISRKQVEDCKAKYIVFGHEHQTKTAMGGKVLIPGNQIPSSIADCLNCKDGEKFYVEVAPGEPPTMKSWKPLNYVEMDWNALVPSDRDFIRVVGQALPDQGAAVAQAISRYRSQSQAFVIANAVTMLSSEDGLTEFAQSLEEVLTFDVMGALLEYLTPQEGKVVKEVMNVEKANS